MPGELEQLCMENAHNGRALKRANEELLEACKDVIARPHIKKPRKVTLTIEVTPRMEEDGLNYPEVAFGVDRKLPGFQSGKVPAVVRGGLVRAAGQMDIEDNMPAGNPDNVVEIGGANNG